MAAGGVGPLPSSLRFPWPPVPGRGLPDFVWPDPGRPVPVPDLDRAAGERPAPERPAPERPAPERPAADRPAPDPPAPQRPPPARPAPERPAPERPAPERPDCELPAPLNASAPIAGLR